MAYRFHPTHLHSQRHPAQKHSSTFFRFLRSLVAIPFVLLAPEPTLRWSVEQRSNMEKPERPERDAPATDWSKMLQPLLRCHVPWQDHSEQLAEQSASGVDEELEGVRGLKLASTIGPPGTQVARSPFMEFESVCRERCEIARVHGG